VVPIWFHWTGEQFVLGSPPKVPKLKALAADPRVALTIDDNSWPYQVLLVRGRSSIELLDDVSATVMTNVGSAIRVPADLAGNLVAETAAGRGAQPSRMICVRLNAWPDRRSDLPMSDRVGATPTAASRRLCRSRSLISGRFAGVVSRYLCFGREVASPAILALWWLGFRSR
jgi:hypothetical protein